MCDVSLMTQTNACAHIVSRGWCTPLGMSMQQHEGTVGVRWCCRMRRRMRVMDYVRAVGSVLVRVALVVVQ